MSKLLAALFVVGFSQILWAEQTTLLEGTWTSACVDLEV